MLSWIFIISKMFTSNKLRNTERRQKEHRMSEPPHFKIRAHIPFILKAANTLAARIHLNHIIYTQ